METTEFKREKVMAAQKISKELFRELRLDIETADSDWVTNTLTARLTGFIYADTVEERDLVYYFTRPTFFEWLLRKPRKAVFKLKVKDLLLSPPKVNDTVRIYNVEK